MAIKKIILDCKLTLIDDFWNFVWHYLRFFFQTWPFKRFRIILNSSAKHAFNLKISKIDKYLFWQFNVLKNWELFPRAYFYLNSPNGNFTDDSKSIRKSLRKKNILENSHANFVCLSNLGKNKLCKMTFLTKGIERKRFIQIKNAKKVYFRKRIGKREVLYDLPFLFFFIFRFGWNFVQKKTFCITSVSIQVSIQILGDSHI